MNGALLAGSLPLLSEDSQISCSTKDLLDFIAIGRPEPLRAHTQNLTLLLLASCCFRAHSLVPMCSWSLSLAGYGHTVPLSDGGKAFCIVYSVIGIPFTLLFLTAVVQRVTVHVTHRPVLHFHVRWGFSKQVVAVAHAILLGLLTVSCFFFIPAAVFSVLEEDWNFLESFYFCFISLSTIGLGDYVPGEGYNQKFRELYKIGITCEYRAGRPGESVPPPESPSSGDPRSPLVPACFPHPLPSCGCSSSPLLVTMASLDFPHC